MCKAINNRAFLCNLLAFVIITLRPHVAVSGAKVSFNCNSIILRVAHVAVCQNGNGNACWHSSTHQHKAQTNWRKSIPTLTHTRFICMCARVCLCLNSLSCDALAFQTATKPPSRDSVVPVCPVRQGHVHRGRCFILTARVLSAFQYAMCALCVCPPFGVLITSCMFLLLVFCFTFIMHCFIWLHWMYWISWSCD